MVVPDFDIVKDIGSGLCSGSVSQVLHSFTFQSREKTLYNSIVPAISFSAHTAADARFFDHLLVFFARILTAPIRVMQDLSGQHSSSSRQQEGIGHGSGVRPLPHRPADQSAEEQIENDRQVQLAFTVPDVGQIHRPRGAFPDFYRIASMPHWNRI